MMLQGGNSLLEDLLYIITGKVFCTHEHYFADNTKGIKDNLFYFPNGGFPVRPTQRLDIGSVSKVWTASTVFS